ncbi:hypothetical protein F4780DRAFT_592996 [Xylariomycetidae sp. FL0641]|nr:hypothetical protein F4780DRAFT_592996 [Xylariomycetidae sp. FL0641]
MKKRQPAILTTTTMSKHLRLRHMRPLAVTTLRLREARRHHQMVLAASLTMGISRHQTSRRIPYMTRGTTSTCLLHRRHRRPDRTPVSRRRRHPPQEVPDRMAPLPGQKTHRDSHCFLTRLMNTLTLHSDGLKRRRRPRRPVSHAFDSPPSLNSSATDIAPPPIPAPTPKPEPPKRSTSKTEPPKRSTSRVQFRPLSPESSQTLRRHREEHGGDRSATEADDEDDLLGLVPLRRNRRGSGSSGTRRRRRGDQDDVEVLPDRFDDGGRPLDRRERGKTRGGSFEIRPQRPGDLDVRGAWAAQSGDELDAQALARAVGSILEGREGLLGILGHALKGI